MSEEPKKKIKKCIEQGQVEFADDPGLISRKEGPASINSIEFWGPWKNERGGNEGGISIHWRKPGIGFGELAFFMKDGKLNCKSETMPRAFAEEILKEFLDEAIFGDGDDEGVLKCKMNGCQCSATHRIGDNKYCQKHAEEHE